MKVFLFLLNIILLVSGQTLWKIGSEKLQMNGWSTIINAMVSPWIMGGAVLYALATVIWIYLLAKLPLSLIYPLQSMAYIFALIIAMVIFKEVIPLTRWIGVIVILFGVYLVTK